MTHLHMREFSGTTFGMEAQSPTALRTLKKKVYYGEITPKGWSRPVKCQCVEAKYVAASLSTKVTRNRFTVSPAVTASFRILSYGQPV